MEVWVVFHYYNARTDNSVCGVFDSEKLAIEYVKKEIEDSEDPADWEGPDYDGYHTTDYDESFEITGHYVKSSLI